MSNAVIVGQQAAADRVTDEGTIAALHQAIGVISSVCDYAQELDAQGFSAADTWLGHVLAQMPAGLWTDSAALTAWDMLRKYRGQLSAAGTDYDRLPRPAGADELEAGRREQAREAARERTRLHARQWREQQYRQTHSYVRCDGEGEQVTLAFPYDPDLVAACQKIEGRRYDGAAKANVFAFASLPQVIELATSHGIEVTADVRALAAIAAARAAEAAAQPQVRLDDRDGTIIIDAPFDPALNQALKQANDGRSTWDRSTGAHRLPARSAKGLPGLAERFGLRISDQARAAIAWQDGQQEGNRAAASAFKADPVPVPGLAAGQALKPQQYPVVRFALEHRRVLVGDEMGWGKTLSSLAAVAADGAYPAVVVCRPSLTLNWVREIRRFFPGLTVHEASGTAPQPVPPGTDVIVIGSAALAAKPRKKGRDGKEFGWVEVLKKAGPKALIIDEGQDTKERAANRSQACEQLAAAVIARDGLVLDLTGTAILNRPRELCQQLTILGRIGEFGGPKAFLWRYCLSETNEWGASYNGARNLIELHERLRSWGIMIRRADDAALGLPPCREHVLGIPHGQLDPAVMARYQQAEADLLGFLAEQARQTAQQLGTDPNSAAVAAAMRASAAEHLVAINTLRQLAGQAKRGYVTAWVGEHVAAGEKVMVAAHHRDQVDAYAEAFGGLKLQGGQTVEEKETAKSAFQELPPAVAPVIAVAIGAGGVGHTLTAARIGIQAEQAWTPGETQQMKKRLHRIGQDREVDYYITVAEGTIDEQLWSVVTAKQATLNAVLDGRSQDGAADDERSVAAELTWRLTQQGLGNQPSDREGADGQTAAAGLDIPADMPGGDIKHGLVAADRSRPTDGNSVTGRPDDRAEARGKVDSRADDGHIAAQNAVPGGHSGHAAGDAAKRHADDGGARKPADCTEQDRGTLYIRDCGAQRLVIHAPRPGELDSAAFAAFAAAEPVLGLDVETSAVDDDGPRQFDPGFTVRLVQFGSEREAWVLNLTDPAQRDAAAAVLADPVRRFVTHTPFDVLAVWSVFGTPLGQRVADTHLLSKLINPDERAGHGLKELSDRYLDDGLSRAEAALHARMQAAAPAGFRSGNAWQRWGWNHLPADDEEYVVYAGMDAIYARRLLPVLARECAPFMHLAPMETWLGAQATGITIRGLRLDRAYATALLAELEDERRGPEAAITAALDCPPASPKFAQWLDRQASVAGITGLARTKTGQLETSADALDKLLREDGSALAADVVDLVRARLAVARTSNLIANVRGFLAAADPEGRVHPQINTLRAKTARMSITGPALQTLKKHDPRLRRCFRAEPGHMLISCDFAQVQTRVAAALSGDTALKSALASGDIHSVTAELMYGPGFTDQQRDISKRATYGTLFGGGAPALAAVTGVSEDAAREVISRWKAAYPGVTGYGQRLAALPEVITPSGRRIPADPARPYASANYVIQSTERDLLLAAVYRLVTQRQVSGLWLFMHDEVIVQVPEHDAEQVRAELQQAMTGVFRGVPILADAKILGPTWGHLDTSGPASAADAPGPGERATAAEPAPDAAPPPQAALFDTAGLQASAPVSGVPAGRFDPAGSDAALRGDGYQWLNQLLPGPQPPACETCHRPMRLPPAAPVLWTCPACHPADAQQGDIAAPAAEWTWKWSGDLIKVYAGGEFAGRIYRDQGPRGTFYRAGTTSDPHQCLPSDREVARALPSIDAAVAALRAASSGRAGPLGGSAPDGGASQPSPSARPVRDDGDDDGGPAQARATGRQLREAAHRYLEDGLLPVPAWAARGNGECRCPRGADCPRPGKHPRSVHAGPGPHDYSWKPLACRTHAEIDERFAAGGAYAAGNLMVAIPAGMMAIDRDDDEGGQAALAALVGELGELPPTLSHKTPHGEHLIYRTPPGWAGRAWVGKDPANPVPPGVDLRMPGQILMAAPSQVPGPGGPGRYGPVAGDHVARLPAAYVTAWTPPQPQPQPAASRVPVPPDSADRAARYVDRAMSGIADDLASRDRARNAAAYAAGLKAGSLLGAARATPGAEQAAAAWTDEAAEQALLAAAERNGSTGQDGRAEALRAIRSGLRNGLRNPRALPDFAPSRPASTGRQPQHRPVPTGQARPQRGQPASAPARRPHRWQDLVPDDIRREIQAADQAASARRRAAIAAHQQALEQHDRSASPGTAAEVERTRAAAHAAHQAYTHDGRHITGRHDAAMLRWAAAITARRDRAAAGPVTGQPDSAWMQANRAVVAANEAYKAGDLDRARQLVDQAAELDPSRTDLWQLHRNEIAARRLVLAARAAHTEGDHQRAGKLLGDARQLDPRLRSLWGGNLPGAPAAQRAGLARDHGRAAPGPRGTASTAQPAPQAGPPQRRQPAPTAQAAGAPRPARRSPAGREPRRAVPRSPEPDRTPPSAPRSATTTAAPREPPTGTDAAADDPDPDATRTTRWPAPNPHSRSHAASPAQQARREADTGQAPAGRSQPNPVTETQSPGARVPGRAEPAADWRDQVMNAAREPWQPSPAQPSNLAVHQSPGATSPGAPHAGGPEIGG